ncbi:hypothetical protein REPUB_Repub09cG0094400 [Reevesia pubescens]
MSWRLRKYATFTETLFSEVISWRVIHVLRESNELADSFARARVNRENSLVMLLS